jgi:hypothetical protein
MQIEEMAFERKEIMDEAKGQFMPLLKHWVLIRYVAMNHQYHPCLEHWKDELVAALWNVGMMDLKKGNSRETVKKAINEMYFTKMQLQNKSFSRQIAKLCEKEHISLDIDEYDTSFKAELPKIVDVMASGNYDNVWDYVDNLITTEHKE